MVMSPIAESVAPALVDFKPQRRRFVLHNGSRKPMETMFAGNMMTVPPVNVVRTDHTEYDADGDPIPGTYVVEDRYEFDPRIGDELLMLNAERAVIHILGIKRSGDGKAKEATSAWALAGLSLIPQKPPKAIWQNLAKEGERRAFLKSVENARSTIEAYSKADEMRKANGKPALPRTAEYDYAMFILEEYGKLARTDYREASTMDFIKEEKERREAEDAAAQLEFTIFLKARVRELVEQAAEGKKIDKIALFKEMIDDPEVRKFAQKDYTWRKKGNRPIATEDLDAAAEMGETISSMGLEPQSEVEKARAEAKKRHDALLKQSEGSLPDHPEPDPAE